MGLWVYSWRWLFNFKQRDGGFGTMSIKISQDKNNIPSLVSILNYFKSSSKIYQKTSSMQITLSGHNL